MSVKIKTHEVILKDGRVFRGVKLTERNGLKIEEWLGTFKESVNWTQKPGDREKAIPRFRIKTRKGVRVAEVGDIIARRRFPGPGYGADGIWGPWMAHVEFIVIKAKDFEKLVMI